MVLLRGSIPRYLTCWALWIHKRRLTIPIYEIEPELGNGKSKVLHRNLLLPLPKAQSSVFDQDVETVTQREGMDSDNDSDHESLVEVWIKQTPQQEVPVPAPRVFGVPRSTSTQVDGLVQTETNGHSVADNIDQTALNYHVSAHDTVQTEADDQVVVDDTMQSSVPSLAEFLSSPVPPRPAPRKSTRLLSTAHLHSDFVYNFQASSGGGHEIAKKVGFLKEVIKLFD